MAVFEADERGDQHAHHQGDLDRSASAICSVQDDGGRQQDDQDDDRNQRIKEGRRFDRSLFLLGHDAPS